MGGGTAGVEAAREAVGAGAEVTVMEKSQCQGPAWNSWPALIQQPRIWESTEQPGRMPPEATVLPSEACFLDSGSVSSTAGPLKRFDAVVAAIGCSFAPVSVRGHRKPGVHELRSAMAYAELGRSRGSILHPVVFGEGTRALQVADQLTGDGRVVRVLTSHWEHGKPSAEVREILEQAAGERGVLIAGGRVTQAVGEGSLEAVVVEGRVACCDSLVLLPDRIPRVIPTAARLGRAGGFSVDRRLRTSSPGIFAAGGCAEICAGDHYSVTLEDEPGMSGRVAGANSVGHSLSMGSVSGYEISAFGLRWTRVEARFGALTPSSLPLDVVAQKWAQDSACAITFERLRGRVVRIELVEHAGPGRPQSPSPSIAGESLRSLAYGGSSDISLVSDTARLGLRHWSDS